jgi:hypothetical protein
MAAEFAYEVLIRVLSSQPSALFTPTHAEAMSQITLIIETLHSCCQRLALRTEACPKPLIPGGAIPAFFLDANSRVPGVACAYGDNELIPARAVDVPDDTLFTLMAVGTFNWEPLFFILTRR